MVHAVKIVIFTLLINTTFTIESSEHEATYEDCKVASALIPLLQDPAIKKRIFTLQLLKDLNCESAQIAIRETGISDPDAQVRAFALKIAKMRQKN